MPVAHAVIAHARSSAGGRCALRSPDRSRTYRDLAADVAAGAEFLRATGTAVGDVVAISLPDPVARRNSAPAATSAARAR